ncbi:MAG: YdeI/OmpD-associated family protein [Pseudomonadota bacterium]
MTANDAEHVEVRSIEALRGWLNSNHTQLSSVWLVTFKKPHPDYLPWADVVPELLCWGWIDSAVRGIDAETFKHLISPRKDTSAWSAVNKELVVRMRNEGRMQPAGEAKITAAEANGMWSFLDDVEALVVPDDLGEALGTARDTWELWSRSIKRAWLEQIKLAKSPPTREKRIAKCAEAARQRLKNGGLR